jgi:hypothetical protein
MQYPHYLCDNIIIDHFCICNTFIAYVITLRVVSGVHVIPLILFYNLSNTLIVSLVFLCFAGLGANVSLGVVKEVMTWEKDGIGLFAKLKLEMHLI